MTDEELAETRKIAETLKLIGRELLEAKDELIKRVCNGIGPSCFPADLRKAIDKMHPSLKQVADIHDMAYYMGDGTDEDFTNANKAFAANGRTVADFKYGWYDPRRYIARHNARKFAAMCQVAGKPAYRNAIRERKDADGCE
jgi:hypothetical protein